MFCARQDWRTIDGDRESREKIREEGRARTTKEKPQESLSRKETRQVPCAEWIEGC